MYLHTISEYCFDLNNIYQTTVVCSIFGVLYTQQHKVYPIFMTYSQHQLQVRSADCSLDKVWFILLYKYYTVIFNHNEVFSLLRKLGAIFFIFLLFSPQHPLVATYQCRKNPKYSLAKGQTFTISLSIRKLFFIYLFIAFSGKLYLFRNPFL